MHGRNFEMNRFITVVGMALMIVGAAFSPMADAATPALDLDGWGVVTYCGGNDQVTVWGMDTYVKVIDHDGIAADGSSHTVSLKLNGETIVEKLPFSSRESGTVAYYGGLYDVTPTPGTYTFTVTDPSGASAEIIDYLNPVVTLAPPKAIAPADGSTVADTSPTFRWNAVSGAKRYRIGIYDMSNKTVYRGNAPDTTSWTVPPGVLAPSTRYKYRVEARDAHIGFEVDSNTIYPVSSDDYIEFTTGPERSAPFIDFDSSGVYTWNHPDAGHNLFFWIKLHDAQGVPDNIKSVTVRFPDYASSGHEERLYYNSNESDTCAAYEGESFPLQIESGNYTFVVEDNDGHVTEKTETLTADVLTPSASFSIVPTSTGDGTGYSFDWDIVSGVAFYRVEIYDLDKNRIYKFVTLNSEYDLAPGFLEKETLYRCRVTAWGEFFEDNVDNAISMPWSSDDWPSAVTLPMAGGGSTPTIDLDSFGAVVYHYPDPTDGSDRYRLGFSVKVGDADGVPKNIRSVTATDGTTTWDLYYNEAVSGTQASYFRWVEIDNPATVGGIYTFRVTDADDKTVQITDDLVVNVLPIPGGLQPADGTSYYGTHPMIQWDTVPGASLYRVRIYNGLWDTLHKSDYTAETSYTVPQGVLDLNQIFSYRIRACRENFTTGGVDLDNLSYSELFSAATQPHVTTRELDLGSSILTLQTLAGMQPEGITIDADVNGDDKIDMAEAVYGLQKTSGLR